MTSDGLQTLTDWQHWVCSQCFYLGSCDPTPECYIAGPMRGIADSNYPAFNRAADAMRGCGWIVHNPAENDASLQSEVAALKPDENPLKVYMRGDLFDVCRSNCVLVLPGWQNSKGARLEVHVAHETDTPVFEFDGGKRVRKPSSLYDYISTNASPSTPVDKIPYPPGKGLVTTYVDSEYPPVEIKTSPYSDLSDMTPNAPTPGMRTFESGATRNSETVKHDFEGFLSLPVIRMFGRYMHDHRVQRDGTVRDSDNWQKGIPREVYMKSLLRHVFDLWELHRGGTPINPDTNEPVTFEEALSGAYFNNQGYAHEYLKEQG